MLINPKHGSAWSAVNMCSECWTSQTDGFNNLFGQITIADSATWRQHTISYTKTHLKPSPAICMSVNGTSVKSWLIECTCDRTHNTLSSDFLAVHSQVKAINSIFSMSSHLRIFIAIVWLNLQSRYMSSITSPTAYMWKIMTSFTNEYTRRGSWTYTTTKLLFIRWVLLNINCCDNYIHFEPGISLIISAELLGS